MTRLGKLQPAVVAISVGLAFLSISGALRSAHAAQIDIPGPPGSGQFGTTVDVLPNGNFVVTDPFYDEGAANIGAVYLYDGATLALISTLKGGSANDVVGNNVNGGLTVLANGNFVVGSALWDNPVGPVADAGAATWCSATTGCNGVVSASNSLIGGTPSDQVGILLTPLVNGHYVVRNPHWDNPAGPAAVGAATWCNGTTGRVGLVTPANSLVGGSAGDQVSSTGVTALTNGNYVVGSSHWKNGTAQNAGAATWGNGTSGTVGVASAANSLVGSTAGDEVSNPGVTALTNGNYVVRSSFGWDNGAATNAGAVTWGSGTGGTVGVVSPLNSLVGTTSSDQIGVDGATALTNGNYVVSSTSWNNPTGPVSAAGAATWGNGTTGTAGPVTAANSLIGRTQNDNVGRVTALTNGNYVVRSPGWHDPAGSNVELGAATWGNGTTGTMGLVTPGNSLVGVLPDDRVGLSGVTALTNGHYVVASAEWNHPQVGFDVGAVTWGNGISGTVGVVTPANSLTGEKVGDLVGSGGSAGTGVTALANGNYVVVSDGWRHTSFERPGAVTWGNGAAGTVGIVTAGNSLIGSVDDGVGGDGVTALTNGNYVVQSSLWSNGGAVAAGAVTWGNGAGGTTGVVGPGNSLVGSTQFDLVGRNAVLGPAVTSLPNGDYVVRTVGWDNPVGPIPDAGAICLAKGTGGTVGPITSGNCVLGTGTGGISSTSIDTLRNRVLVGRAPSNVVSILGALLGLDQPEPPDLLRICGAVSLTGQGITSGTLLKAYLARSSGPVDVILDGLSATSTTDTTWSGNFPCPWAPPNGFDLGQGFLALELVRPETGFEHSNLVGVPLVGNPAQGVPSILAIGGTFLSDTSWVLSFAVANVEQVVPQDVPVHIDGEGFASPVVNVFTSAGNCGPIAPTASSGTDLDLVVPASCPTGPGSFQVVNATGSFRASNAVSAPIGAAIGIDDVLLQSNTITVQGTGFSTLTVINFFASDGNGVANFGGLDGGGPVIPLNFVDETEFSFTRPAGALAGAAFVEAINPPFIPVASSGNDPDGAITLP